MRTSIRHGRTARIGLLSLVATIGLCAQAEASSTVGSTFTPTSECSPNFTILQTASVGNAYTVPTSGVLTSWSYQAESGAEHPVRLKVARGAQGSYAIIGDSPVKVPPAGELTTYTDLRVPVMAGDVLGLSTSGFALCENPEAGYDAGYGNADYAPGSGAQSYSITSGYRLDVSAKLEADADGDGYGDETQDGCPAQASSQTVCQPPETTITEHPKAQSKQKSSQFTFVSSFAGSTFECSLDGAAFSGCTSPQLLTVKPGKHHFVVQAVSGGKTDATPASFDWKVLKKKHKKHHGHHGHHHHG